METAPVADEVAKALGANLFYTRLSGHGLPGDAMGRATAQDWLADTLEAVRIGEALGEKVLVISCSTGATLSTWLGTGSEASKVSAHVFISPNFGLKNKLSELVNGHWGHQIAFAVSGDTISYKPSDPRDAQAWTTSYPTQAIFPMLALVKKYATAICRLSKHRCWYFSAPPTRRWIPNTSSKPSSDWVRPIKP